MSFRKFYKMLPLIRARETILVCTGILVLGLSFEGIRQEPTEASWRGLTAKEWREDLAYLSEQLVLRHVDPFHSISQVAFEQTVTQLHEAIPKMEDDEVVAELARLVASIGDGHTRVSVGAHIRERLYPIRVRLFPEGLYIIGSTPSHERLIGTRIISLGRVEAKQLLDQLKNISSADNEMNRKHHLAENLRVPAYLYGLRIAKNPESAEITVITEDGEQFSETLRPVADAEADWHFVHDRLPKKPQYLRRPFETFWFEFLPDERSLYVQVNAVRDGESETMKQFYERVLDRAAGPDVRRLILDIRFNGGGNGFLNWPLIYGLIANRNLNQSGRLFVIIGRQTYSAAGQLAVLLERHTEAIFVGEPTGAAPNHYGDARPFFLPNSELRLGASSLYWQVSLPWDDRPWVPPDLSAELTWADYRNGHDPAMSIISGFEPSESLAERFYQRFLEGGMDAVRESYLRWKDQAVHRWTDFESELNQLGDRLLWDDRMEDAIAVFRVNVEEHPASASVYDSLAEAYLQAGETKLATQYYRKALDIDPKLVSALSALEDIRRGKFD